METNISTVSYSLRAKGAQHSEAFGVEEKNTNWIDVKFPKDGKIGMAFILLIFNIGFILLLLILLMGDNNIKQVMWYSIWALFFLIFGWTIPVFLIYLRVPRSIAFTDIEIIFKTRTGREIRFLKEEIQKVQFSYQIMSKEPGYSIFNDFSNPHHAISVDEISGKLVYDWYYNDKEPNAE